MKTKLFVAVVFVLLVLGFTLPSPGLDVSAGLFQSEPPPGPTNDNFADAVRIDGLPATYDVDTSYASLESAEPIPSSCAYYPWGRSVWYVYTPAQSGWLTAYSPAEWWTPTLAAYSGTSLGSLSEVGARCWGGQLTFRAEAGMTYYFQIGGLWEYGGMLTFYLEEYLPQPPLADFWFYPSDPSMFDSVWFSNNSWDPEGLGIESSAWDFGDGTTSTDWSPSHQYAADGDYTIQLTVTTSDGRSASTTQTVSVRTHDVAITKFSVPKAAAVGQTRPIVVGVSSKRYPEQVEVQLFKSVPGGYEWVGTLRQSVPVRPAGRTTNFTFNYTFTADDARIGKVTFKAVANLLEARDALPADNEAISTPTKVTR